MHINEFAEILLKSRKQKGLSQSELAKKSGFTKRAIQYWEKGKKSISLENADRLLTALGVEIKIGKTDVNGNIIYHYHFPKSDDE